MSEIEKSILNQMWIFTAALKTLYWLNAQNRYSAQVDVTIENLRIASQMLLTETRRQHDALKCQ